MRIEGQIEGSYYVIRHEGEMTRIPLDEAKGDKKLQKAIKRNGWEAISED